MSSGFLGLTSGLSDTKQVQENLREQSNIFKNEVKDHVNSNKSQADRYNQLVKSCMKSQDEYFEKKK